MGEKHENKLQRKEMQRCKKTMKKGNNSKTHLHKEKGKKEKDT